MNFVKFVQFTKVNGMNHTVEGILTDETPDKVGEICDYASSVPHYKVWSGEFHKATNGASMGNVREMHQMKAVGKFKDITYDDANKAITGVAEIVDPLAWEKCEKGVYTGFSHGGAYVGNPKREGQFKRYTAKPTEVSLVDNPCNPSAHFTYVKADGSTELRKFVGSEQEAETQITPPDQQELTGSQAAIGAASAVEHDAAEQYHLTQAAAVADTADPLSVKHTEAAGKHRAAASALRDGHRHAGWYSADARNASDALRWPSSVSDEDATKPIPNLEYTSAGKKTDTNKVAENVLDKGGPGSGVRGHRGIEGAKTATTKEDHLEAADLHEVQANYHEDRAVRAKRDYEERGAPPWDMHRHTEALTANADAATAHRNAANDGGLSSAAHRASVTAEEATDRANYPTSKAVESEITKLNPTGVNQWSKEGAASATTVAYGKTDHAINESKIADSASAEDFKSDQKAARAHESAAKAHDAAAAANRAVGDENQYHRHVAASSEHSSKASDHRSRAANIKERIGKVAASFLDGIISKSVEKTFPEGVPDLEPTYDVLTEMVLARVDSEGNLSKEAEREISLAAKALMKDAATKPYGDVTYADPGYQEDKKKRYPVNNETRIRAAWNYIHQAGNAAKYTGDQVSSIKSRIVSAWKSKIDKDGPPSAEKVMKAIEDIVEKAMADAKMEKGMDTVQQLARILSQLAWLQWGVYNEQVREGDDSPLPNELRAQLTTLAGTLVTMVQEETRELVEGANESKPPDDLGVPCGVPCGPLYCLADSGILKASLTEEEEAAFMKDFIDIGDGIHLVRAFIGEDLEKGGPGSGRRKGGGVEIPVDHARMTQHHSDSHASYMNARQEHLDAIGPGTSPEAALNHLASAKAAEHAANMHSQARTFNAAAAEGGGEGLKGHAEEASERAEQADKAYSEAARKSGPGKFKTAGQ
jgi:hypothetical protein